MRRALFLVSLTALAALAMAGCDQNRVGPAGAASSVPDLKVWCRSGGMDAAKDPRCKRLADDDFKKFLGKSGGS